MTTGFIAETLIGPLGDNCLSIETGIRQRDLDGLTWGHPNNR